MARVYGTVLQKFLAKIRVSEALEWNGTPCRIWTDRANRKGYGTLKVKGKSRKAHRISHELFKGPIPLGLEPDHLCRVRNCENPDHLEAVTPYENFLRGNGRAAGVLIGERQKAKTHCPRGHEYTPENTYIRITTQRNPCRVCRQCYRKKQLHKYHANRAANCQCSIDEARNT